MSSFFYVKGASTLSAEARIPSKILIKLRIKYADRMLPQCLFCFSDAATMID